jgi:hypothetical protein
MRIIFSCKHFNLFSWLATQERRISLQTGQNNFLLFYLSQIYSLLTIQVLIADIAVGGELEYFILFYSMIIYCLPVNRSDLSMRSGLSSSAGGGFRGVWEVVHDIQIMHHFLHIP